MERRQQWKEYGVLSKCHQPRVMLGVGSVGPGNYVRDPAGLHAKGPLPALNTREHQQRPPLHPQAICNRLSSSSSEGRTQKETDP